MFIWYGAQVSLFRLWAGSSARLLGRCVHQAYFPWSNAGSLMQEDSANLLAWVPAGGHLPLKAPDHGSVTAAMCVTGWLGSLLVTSQRVLLHCTAG